MVNFNKLLEKKNKEESLLSRNRKSVGVASIPIEIDKIVLVNLSEILPNVNQPRKNFENDESIKELAESIKEVGLQSPIIVNKTGSKYQILVGHRRYYAYTNHIPEEKQIKCIVWHKEKMSDDDRDKIALVENLQRKELNPAEIAETLYRLKEHGTAETIQRITGYKRSSVSEYLTCYRAIDHGVIKREDLIKDGVRKTCEKIRKLKQSKGDITLGSLTRNTESSTVEQWYYTHKKPRKEVLKVVIEDPDNVKHWKEAKKICEGHLITIKGMIGQLR